MNLKKPLSLLLGAALSLSLAAPALAAQPEGWTPADGARADAPWYAQAQSYVTEKGIMTGTDKGFEPDGIVTRATVFQTLYNLEQPEEATLSIPFPDTTGTWYDAAANWAGATGLSTGDEAGNFNGDRAITRAEIATIITRYSVLKGNLSVVDARDQMEQAPDFADIPAWALDGMAFCYDAGIIRGDENGALNPNGTATRAELATILMNFDQLPFAPYIEQTVSYESEGRTVPAVVTLPTGEGPFPAVVINHGHGGSKDENVGFIGVARALAEAGFASIRMDFAGCGDSTAPFTENTLSNMEADSNAGLAYLLENYDIDADRLGILGYSMGGRLALEIVSKENNPYKAVVLLSAAANPGEDCIAGVLPEGVTQAEAIAQAEETGSFDYTTIYGQNLSLSAEWFTDMLVDPLAEIDNYTGPMLVLHGDQDVVVTDETNKLIVAAYPAAQEIIVPGADHGYGFYSDQPDVTAMVEGSITQFFYHELVQTSLTLEEYLDAPAYGWFSTGKTEYTIQGMMVSKETSFHNPLEVTDYTVTDDGVSVILKGTAGEQWVSKLEKVMATYTKADGSPLTAEDFAEKDVFIDLKTKAEPDTNLAMFVPADISVTVNTAWGDVLHTNLPNAPHGAGDCLVCRPNEDGTPDLSDVWVVNGEIFSSTYDTTALPLTATVTEIEKYGHAVLDVTIADFQARGYALGDIVTVTVYPEGSEEASYTADMPYLDGYYVDNGEAMLRAYPGHTNIAVCINYGKFNVEASAAAGSRVVITMAERQGAAALQATYSLRYTNDRADYDSDEIFANFRPVVMGDIAEGRLYRSASPINNENGRAATADDLIEAVGIQAVFNLADTDEELTEYMAAEDFDSPYYAQLIADGNVIALGMPVNYASDEFAAGIVKGLTFLSEQEGPYLIHCTEGKDRAGFTAALLEALMGADLDEIVADYMESYENYYHLDPEADKDKYDLIAGGNVMEMLRSVAGLEKGADLTGVDLVKAAEDYLTSHGMTETALAALKANLSK